MTSLFKQPGEARNVTFMIRGEAGSGKTRFALGLKRVTGLPVAYVGTDRGAKFYANDPEIGGFLQVESRDADVIDSALGELNADSGKSFGGVVVDTVTDWWNAEQRKFEVKGKDGKPVIPMRAWRPLREGHEQKLRGLQALPLHVVLVCEEKPVYERDGEELREVGTKEDSDKKDSYVSDVRLRFFVRNGRFFAEVLKDRTGKFEMGAIVENPKVEMWVDGRAKAAPQKLVESKKEEPVEDPLDKQANEVIAEIGAIKNKVHWGNWRRVHATTLSELLAALPEGETKRRLIEAGMAKTAQLFKVNIASQPEATA